MTDETNVTGLIERPRRESKAHASGIPGPRRYVMALLDDTADAIESLQADVHNAREAALANKSIAEEARAAIEASQREADAKVREAVIAERERCAEVASTHPSWISTRWGQKRPVRGRDIAAAIRSQETGGRDGS